MTHNSLTITKSKNWHRGEEENRHEGKEGRNFPELFAQIYFSKKTFSDTSSNFPELFAQICFSKKPFPIS